MSDLSSSLGDQARYRAIVEQQIELVCCYLPDGTLTYVNEAYARFFNHSREEFVGKPFKLMVGMERHPAILEHIQWQVVNKTPRTEIQRGRLPDGSEWVVEWTDQALCDTDGNVLEILAIGRDATERIHAAEEHQELEIARAELHAERSLNTLRSNLMRLITHELRTPLSIIQTSANIFERYLDRLSQSERNERLKVIQGQVKRIAKMLDDIAFSLRLQMQHLVISPTSLNIATMIRNMTRELEATIGKDHPFLVEIDDEAEQVWLDTTLMHRIMINLLTNAIKYSPPGTSIDIYARRENGHLVLIVRDHGIGIPENDAEHLFEPFFRGSNVGNIEGTGIGLSLVRECVDAHGGTLEVVSAVGTGTTFTIYIPQSEPQVSSFPH